MRSGAATRRAVGGRLRSVVAATGLALLGTIGFTVVPASMSGATTTDTLYVDNVLGTQITGCTSPGSGACETIQEGIIAAEALQDTAVTLDVAGSSTPYDESDQVDIIAGTNDTLEIVGTGVTPPVLDDGGSGTDLTLESTNVGPVTVDRLTVNGGDSSSAAGGISELGTGSLTVEDDTFSDDVSSRDGAAGAIAAADGCLGGRSDDLTVIDSTFTDDGQDEPSWGAIDDSDCEKSGTFLVEGSTFVDDTGYGQIAAWVGGTIVNSTIVTDSSVTGAAVVSDSSVTLTDDTFSGSVGPAIADEEPDDVADSILDDTGGNCSGSPITDEGYNVASDASCPLGPTSISSSRTIDLQPLAANGSAGAPTEAITSSSSAYHEVPAGACTISTDERGGYRPGIGTDCDAGAYEVEPPAGYDLVGSDGGVFVFPLHQSGGFYGSLPGLGVHVSDIVGIVPTSGFHGYDLVGADGGVFVFPLHQSGGFYGSLPGLGVTPAAPIVGIVPTATDTGYFLVGRDGGVFAFHTTFSGSLPEIHDRVDDVVGIAATSDDKGYWVVEADGVVHAFGDATDYGNAPDRTSPAVSIAATPDGGGYWVAYADGTVVGEGDAAVYGTASAPLTAPIVSLVPTTDGLGYWLVGRDGNLYPLGDAAADGSLPALHVAVDDVVGAVPTG